MKYFIDGQLFYFKKYVLMFSRKQRNKRKLSEETKF